MEDKRFNPERAQHLMSDDRRKALPPHQLIAHLDIHPNDVIADLGAGNGYFAIPMAKKAKTIYAVDIEPKMLGMLEENANAEQLNNVEYINSNLDKIQLADHSVHKVMISLVLHEVPNLDQTLNEIKRILKPNGQMLIIEWEVVQTESGPPPKHRIASAEMKDILVKSGFEAEFMSFDPYYAVKSKLKA